MDNKEFYFELLTRFFTDEIPFNKFLGLELEHLEAGRAVFAIDKRPEFIGSPFHKALHGGVISTLIDVTGGITAFSVLNWPQETAVNTVDLRIDYVRRGTASRFSCEGTIIRKGNRIVVTRCDLRDEEGQIIALGTATYNIFTNSQMLEDYNEK